MDLFIKYRKGEPCEHPGCLSHVSHPCDGCGRTHGSVNHNSAGRNGNITPRECVLKFAVDMEKALLRNDHKVGWQDARCRWLLHRLKEELDELEAVLRCPNGSDSVGLAVREAADVANFAMMIADNIKKRGSII
jgi:hypothetical protein